MNIRKGLLQVVENIFFQRFQVGFIHNIFFQQCLSIEYTQGWACLDAIVHERLGKIGFVPFIVPIPAITNHIDNHILAESVAIISRQSAYMNGGLRVFAMYMEDGHHEHFGDIG